VPPSLGHGGPFLLFLLHSLEQLFLRLEELFLGLKELLLENRDLFPPPLVAWIKPDFIREASFKSYKKNKPIRTQAEHAAQNNGE
jgi:hypothetical protein